MAAVRLGGDRQEVHEAIRVHAQEAAHQVKARGARNDLLDRLRKEPLLEGVDLDSLMDPGRYVGRSVGQVEAFQRDVVEPTRTRYAAQVVDDAALHV